MYRKNIYLDNYIPRIMEDDLFFKVQNLLVKKEKHKTNTKVSLFSGLVYCYTCQHRLTKLQDNRVKSKLIRYSCDNVYRYKTGTKEKKCNNNITIREDVLENYLLENLESRLEECELESLSQKAITMPDNSKEIKKLENKINKLKDLYLDDLIDKDTYSNDYKKYISELNTLKNNLPKEYKDFSNVKKIINSNYITIYNKLSIENKRKFWLSFIDKIYILDGKVKEFTSL